MIHKNMIGEIVLIIIGGVLAKIGEVSIETKVKKDIWQKQADTEIEKIKNSDR